MRRVVVEPSTAQALLREAADLGHHLRAARTQSGLSLEEAALLVGMSKQTLFKAETDPAGVSLGLILKAARGLGVSVLAVPAEQEAAACAQLDGLMQRHG